MEEAELGWGAFAWVMVGGVAFGLVALAIFRRLSRGRGIRSAGNRVVAHLLEFLLFVNEPRVVLRAQRDIVIANLRWIRCMWQPLLLTTVLSLVAWTVGQGLFGSAPLPVGSATVVTAHVAPSSPEWRSLRLATPGFIQVETPPVHAEVRQELAWRIRAVGAARGRLFLRSGDRQLSKSIVAGAGFAWVSQWPEPIHIQYPTAIVLGHSWLLWFSLAAFASASSYSLVWTMVR